MKNWFYEEKKCPICSMSDFSSGDCGYCKNCLRRKACGYEDKYKTGSYGEGCFFCKKCGGSGKVKGDFITIHHSVVANLFLNRMVHVKIKSGKEGEVLCTPAILKAFTLGQLEHFKVFRDEVDQLVSDYHSKDKFALYVLQYGIEQDERNEFYNWRMGR